MEKRPRTPDQDAATRIVDALGPEGAQELLDVLGRKEEDRAALIGRLHRRDAPIAEVLIDLEEDPLTRVRVREALRSELNS